MTVRVRVDLGDSLTFGDLYQFVDLARASNVDPETKVVQVPVSEQEPELGIDCFELEAAADAKFEAPLILQADDARALASVLDAVIEEEGDARKVLDELRQWRNQLVGLHVE